MKRKIIFIIKRIPQLVAAFLIYDMARVFYFAMFPCGISYYQTYWDYSLLQTLNEWGSGYFGDYIWILAVELFIYVPLGFYWVFRDEIKKITAFATKG